VTECQECRKEICEDCVRKWIDSEYEINRKLCPLCFISIKQEQLIPSANYGKMPIPIPIFMILFSASIMVFGVVMPILNLGAIGILIGIPFIAVPSIMIYIGIRMIRARNKYKEFENLEKQEIVYTHMLGPEFKETISHLSENSENNEEYYCEYCGTRIRKGENRCSNCGASIKKNRNN
jgi:hypothetical protein